MLLNCGDGGKISSGSSFRRVLLDADKSRLAAIYAKCFALVACFIFFGGLSWAKVASESSFLSPSGQVVSANVGSSLEMKPFLLVANEISNRFATLEHSFASLAECIDMLAKRLETPEPMVSQLSPGCQLLVTPSSQNQEVDIIISESLGVVTSGKTVAEAVIFDSLVMKKMEDTLSNLSIIVMGLAAKLDNAGLVPVTLFKGVCVFTSGLEERHLGAGVAIIMNNSLARHVFRVEEIPSHIVSVHLLFKGKVLVSIVDLYACASSSDQFGQTSAGASTWSNSKGIEKVIDYVLISGSLILAVVNHRVDSVSDFFDIDHRVISVLVDLGGLLDV
ncbi:hypothetical protein G9A89_005900 [Geosiphon pyriformis]|nr:hypothetical protein G9A89_005900 [Geosiphon pyriformis]